MPTRTRTLVGSGQSFHKLFDQVRVAGEDDSLGKGQCHVHITVAGLKPTALIANMSYALISALRVNRRSSQSLYFVATENREQELRTYGGVVVAVIHESTIPIDKLNREYDKLQRAAQVQTVLVQLPADQVEAIIETIEDADLYDGHPAQDSLDELRSALNDQTR